MARPPKGPKLVDSLEGDEHTKARLRVVLETITGETPIAEAVALAGELSTEDSGAYLNGLLGALAPTLKTNQAKQQ